MASQFEYTTVTELENLLLIDVVSAFESQVETWIGAAEKRVNNYLGYVTASGLWNEVITEELNDARIDGDGNLVIHPRKRPINSVSGISLRKGSETTALTLTDGDSNNKYVIPVQGDVIVYPSFELTTTGAFSITNFNEVKYSRWYTDLDYTAGYTTIPADITHATTLIAADIFMRHANKEGLTALTQGRITKRWREREDGKSDLILDAENILNHYRIASGWF